VACDERRSRCGEVDDIGSVIGNMCHVVTVRVVVECEWETCVELGKGWYIRGR
jgi:hypothetical protein